MNDDRIIAIIFPTIYRRVRLARQRLYEKVPPLPLGQQMQLDFGEATLGNGKKLYIFGTLLSASRFKYTAFQEKPFKAEDIIKHLLDCFDYFGGLPQELVIDQDRALVVSENCGIIFIWNALTIIEIRGYFLE